MVDLSNFRHFLDAREAVRSDTLSIWHCEAPKRAAGKSTSKPQDAVEREAETGCRIFAV